MPRVRAMRAATPAPARRSCRQSPGRAPPGAGCPNRRQAQQPRPRPRPAAAGFWPNDGRARSSRAVARSAPTTSGAKNSPCCLVITAAPEQPGRAGPPIDGQTHCQRPGQHEQRISEGRRAKADGIRVQRQRPSRSSPPTAPGAPRRGRDHGDEQRTTRNVQPTCARLALTPNRRNVPTQQPQIEWRLIRPHLQEYGVVAPGMQRPIGAQIFIFA